MYSRGKIRWLVVFVEQTENGIESIILALRTAGSKEETTYHHPPCTCPALASRIGFRASSGRKPVSRGHRRQLDVSHRPWDVAWRPSLPQLHLVVCAAVAIASVAEIAVTKQSPIATRGAV
jgi:hypothetical protein